MAHWVRKFEDSAEFFGFPPDKKILVCDTSHHSLMLWPPNKILENDIWKIASSIPSLDNTRSVIQHNR